MRGAMSAMSNASRIAAEEAFLEHTPWANPQHPVHHHQQQQTQPQRPQQNRGFEQPRAPAFTTPAAQKRVVDIHAPNGSGSTIAENSSTNNTPYGTEQEPHPNSNNNNNNPFGSRFGIPDYDADRHSGFRSLSSSPLDMRKPHLHFDGRQTQDLRSDPKSHNMAYSLPSA